MTLKKQSTFNRIMIGFWSIPAEQNTSSSVRHYQSLSFFETEIVYMVFVLKSFRLRCIDSFAQTLIPPLLCDILYHRYISAKDLSD